MLTTILLPLTLLTTTFTTATPIHHQARADEPSIPSDWVWHVTGWHAGCARAGCSYNFNVTVPTVPDTIAGVKAYCSGYESYTYTENGTYVDQNSYRNCQILEGVNNGVSAKFGPRETDDGRGPQKFWLSFTRGAYEPEGRPEWNFTGSHDTIYNAFVAPLQDFDVEPTEVTAVE